MKGGSFALVFNFSRFVFCGIESSSGYIVSISSSWAESSCLKIKLALYSWSLINYVGGLGLIFFPRSFC